MRERAGERASEPRSGLTGFTGSRRKLCEHDCAGPSLPPAARRHGTAQHTQPSRPRRHLLKIPATSVSGGAKGF